jgi:hypothetical protein
MKCKSYESAKRQAQDNADQTGVAWVAFIDTSGNARCERATSGPVKSAWELFLPKPLTLKDVI